MSNSSTCKLSPRAAGSPKPPIWQINNTPHQQEQQQTAPGKQEPQMGSCSLENQSTPEDRIHPLVPLPAGVACCKTLKDDDERRLVNPAVVKDIVIGLSDGLTVPFGLTAGLAATGNSKVVVIGGVAELISGALSMAVGGYLSAQAERDHFRYLKTATRKRVQRSCINELQREVSEVLGSVGIEEKLCRGVADSLIKVEPEYQPPVRRRVSFWRRSNPVFTRSRGGLDPHSSSTNGYAVSEKPSTNKAVEEVGMTAFLLKFGEGEEEIPNSRLIISALTIGISYAVGGIIPLFPYFFEKRVHIALFISIGVTALTLVVFGIVKAYYTGSRIGLVGYSTSAVATLAIGGMAAGAAYGISRAIESQYSV